MGASTHVSYSALLGRAQAYIGPTATNIVFAVYHLYCLPADPVQASLLPQRSSLGPATCVAPPLQTLHQNQLQTFDDAVGDPSTSRRRPGTEKFVPCSVAQRQL